MGEIDTKPIESVQTAITFFGQSNEQRKNSPTNDKEVEREREMESLERELASVRVQLEAKEAVHKQALLKVDHYQKTASELSTLLKNSDAKKNFYINESHEASSRVTDLESSLEKMARLLSEAKLESTSQMQAMERRSSEEKEQLSRQVSDANEAVTHLKMEGVELERSYAAALAAKEAEKQDCLRKQIESLNDLESELMEKTTYADLLQIVANDAVSELEKLKEEMELQEKRRLDQAAYISVVEAEVKQIRSEIEEATHLNEYVESMKMELDKSREQENEAQVEIALLKFQLHKGRSKLAAAEAAEARAQSEKTALYNALQQMGLEAEETKRENRMLKEASKLPDPQENNETETEAEAENEVQDAKQEEFMSNKELEDTKRELEVAVAKIGELRARAEQAMSRAEAAEKAKAAMEEQNKKRREHKERRKAALAALRLESISRELENKSIKDEDEDDYGSAKIYQPLGKVLNMKF